MFIWEQRRFHGSINTPGQKGRRGKGENRGEALERGRFEGIEGNKVTGGGGSTEEKRGRKNRVEKENP